MIKLDSYVKEVTSTLKSLGVTYVEIEVNCLLLEDIIIVPEVYDAAVNNNLYHKITIKTAI